jgi:hypothetical protein
LSFEQDGVVGPGYSGRFAETHHEMFTSCPKRWVPVAGETRNSVCDARSPIEPLVEFLDP